MKPRSSWIRRIVVLGIVIALAGLAAHRWGAGVSSSSAARHAGTVGSVGAARSIAALRIAAARIRAARRSAAIDLHIAPGALALTGKVVGPDGAPIAGATVTLDGKSTVASAPDGTFAFDDLRAGSYELAGELAGGQPGGYGDRFGQLRHVEVTAGSEPVTLTLTTGPTVVIHVVDPDGAPVEGASVATYDRSDVTGPDGVARLRAFSSSSTVRIEAMGYAPVDLSVDPAEQLTQVFERTVTLAPGAMVAGIVVDPSGAPVPAADVALDAAGGRSSERLKADATGHWQVAWLAAGRHAVRASSSRFIEAADQIFATDGRHPRLDLVVRLAVGAEVTGRVIDEAGAPLAGATIRGGTMDNDTTDAAGRFVWHGAREGRADLSAVTPTAASSVIRLQLVPGQRYDVLLVMHRASLAGSVRDPHGHPIAGATVFAATKDGTMAFGQSDAGGQFDLGGTPPGDYTVSVQRDSPANGEAQAQVTVAVGPSRVALVLPETAALIGRVTSGGEPVVGFGYSLSSPASPSLGDSPSPVRAPDGRFALHDLALGAWKLVIRAPGFAPRTLGPIEIAAGREVDLGDVELERGRVVRGRVVGDDGAPIAGATVRISEHDDGFGDGMTALFAGHPSAVTGGDGRYEIGGVAAGDGQRIRATHPERGMSTDLALAPGDTEIELMIAATGSIDGSIANVIRRQQSVSASSLSDGRKLADVPVDAAGGFQFDALPPDRYLLRVAGDNALGALIVTVVAGARVPAAFEMPRDPITLHIEAGNPSCLVELKTTGEAPDTLAMAFCGDGVADIYGVAPGHYQTCANQQTCTPLTVTASPAIQKLTIPHVDDAQAL
ncbi:MAG TPA: carboxypeptidase-like regulatory domain-containing protein [Kofleriaceae bacterium]|nr:carboxypeptidase-like regulatory domain-containing protein [Kofleriaceae bacterium]